jgi:hypothetical protein
LPIKTEKEIESFCVHFLRFRAKYPTIHYTPIKITGKNPIILS